MEAHKSDTARKLNQVLKLYTNEQLIQLLSKEYLSQLYLLMFGKKPLQGFSSKNILDTFRSHMRKTEGSVKVSQEGNI